MSAAGRPGCIHKPDGGHYYNTVTRWPMVVIKTFGKAGQAEEGLSASISSAFTEYIPCRRENLNGRFVFSVGRITRYIDEENETRTRTTAHKCRL